MNFYLLLFSFLLAFNTLFSQDIHHVLSMPNPETHYFHVQLELTDFEETELILSLPVWAPGSYLIREFSQNINRISAKDENGKQLSVEKVRKNKWKVLRNNAKKVIVNYEYYAFELTVRTSFLDMSHGYVNGTNIFMYPEGYKDKEGRLTVVPHSSFEKVSTALNLLKDGEASDGKFEYSFQNYDELGDCPIEMGNHEEFSFEAAGITHRVAMYGVGNYSIERLKTDMAKVIESTANVYGENPNKDYLFIIHNSDVGSGGLEHINSTTLNVNRWTYEGRGYLPFLSLVAHEYFHLWHVKRFRPFELGPFDYDRENYTDLLWVMEGFTSYYDELILRRAGFYTEDQYLSKLRSTLNYVEGLPGNKVQPVAHSSFDAWIKAYRPNENSRNTTISYYSKGHLIAAVFDAMMIKKYKGKKSMDDFLQLLYTNYYKKENRGIKKEEFKKELEKFIGMDLTDFFNDHIYGTKTIDFAKYFAPLGLEISMNDAEKVAFGVNASDSNGKLIVRSVTSGSEAEKAGLSPNDEIISFQGIRVGQSDFNKYLEELNVGSEFLLIISRDGLLEVLQAKMGTLPGVKYSFDLDSSNKLAKYWLRTDD
jgi:predicted metalloprotease with PDZ domain